MAKGKRKSSGNKRAAKVQKRKQKRKAQAREQATSQVNPPIDVLDLPDRRVMEGAMQRMLGGMSGGADSPLQQAQDLIYSAYEIRGSRKRKQMALEALSICPDCADAFVLLAEEASSLKEALQLNEDGVAAGERALGDEFEEMVGHFWGILETRPYMRARMGLGQCLWSSGRRQEAIENYHDMLRLNPNDNQGVRDLLASSLLELGRYDELNHLLEEYEEDCSTTWKYTQAVAAFQQEGDSDRARSLLTEALETNEHVPTYLTGAKRLPRELPEYVTWGGEDDAIGYAASFLSGWKATPGAVAWLRKIASLAGELDLNDSGDFGDSGEQDSQSLIRAISELPQTPDESWIADIRQMPVGDADNPPWCVLLLNATDGDVLELDVEETPQTPDDLWQILCEAMQDPRDDGDPHRPEEVHFLSQQYFDALDKRLESIGITAFISDLADDLNGYLEQLMQQSGSPAPELVDVSDLDKLPQINDVIWQADVRPMQTWLREEGEIVRAWSVMVTHQTDDLILAQNVIAEQPSPDALWLAVCGALQNPSIGEPHRPGELQVRSEDHHLLLKPHLEELGIRCTVHSDLDQWDVAFAEMEQTLNRKSDSFAPLSEIAGVSREQVGRFFEAAAEFYKRAPWHFVPSDFPFQVDCEELLSLNPNIYAVAEPEVLRT